MPHNRPSILLTTLISSIALLFYCRSQPHYHFIVGYFQRKIQLPHQLRSMNNKAFIFTSFDSTRFFFLALCYAQRKKVKLKKIETFNLFQNLLANYSDHEWIRRTLNTRGEKNFFSMKKKERTSQRNKICKYLLNNIVESLNA